MLCSFYLKYSSSRYRWLTSPLHIEAAVGGLGGGGVGWVEQAWGWGRGTGKRLSHKRHSPPARSTGNVCFVNTPLKALHNALINNNNNNNNNNLLRYCHMALPIL